MQIEIKRFFPYAGIKCIIGFSLRESIGQPLDNNHTALQSLHTNNNK